jgi:nucleoid DNA-binding protein
MADKLIRKRYRDIGEVQVDGFGFFEVHNNEKRRVEELSIREEILRIFYKY